MDFTYHNAARPVRTVWVRFPERAGEKRGASRRVSLQLVSRRPFAKYEGLGNDFIVVDAASETDVSPALAVAVCDRRRGIGADGVLVVLPPRAPGADARMRVLNADGSVAQMCGNGLRCVALHVMRRRNDRAHRSVVVDTDSGVRTCTVVDGWTEGTVEADMGAVTASPPRTIQVGGETWTVYPVDAGNPHAVIVAPADPNTLARLGPVISEHADFPGGVNVELAELREGRVDVVVWERGVGPTLACGTGACAAVIGLLRAGHTVRRLMEPVAVRLPGGSLTIQFEQVRCVGEEQTVQISLRGPARFVFSGEFDRPAFPRAAW
jgi:diaminopimelate epimerase